MFFVELETPRLSLRNIGTQDRAFVFGHFSDPEVTRYLYDAEPLTEMAGADEIIDVYLLPEPRGQHRWILERKEDGTKIGTCGFHCWNPEEGSVELGYDLAVPFWRMGYMTEALQAIVGFAKQEMRVKHIHAHVSVENPASYKLMEKLGFVKTGAYDEVFRGEAYPHDIYTLELP
jgi:ribosomal-protein-alanine N-acetyltransferase